jgi:hypothetical protein
MLDSKPASASSSTNKAPKAISEATHGILGKLPSKFNKNSSVALDSERVQEAMQWYQDAFQDKAGLKFGPEAMDVRPSPCYHSIVGSTIYFVRWDLICPGITLLFVSKISSTPVFRFSLTSSIIVYNGIKITRPHRYLYNMVSQRKKVNSNNAQSLKKKGGFSQLPFLLSRQTRKNRGSKNTSDATTRLSGLRIFSLRFNKAQPLLQSPVKEASAAIFQVRAVGNTNWRVQG